MKNKQNVLDGIKKVRELIASPYSWAVNWFAFDLDGNPLAYARDPKACRWCLVGACHKIADESNDSVQSWELQIELEETLLQGPKPEPTLPQVNDLGGHEVVIALLDKTIERLSA